MKSGAKPCSLFISLLISGLLVMMFLTGILPVTTAQASTFQKKQSEGPADKPGDLTITWYSAKRLLIPVDDTKYTVEGKFGNLIDNALNFNKKPQTTLQIDTVKSNEAYNSWDRSVCLGTEKINNLTFDLTKWMPVALALPPQAGIRDKYVWGEVTGYIRMPITGCLIITRSSGTTANCVFETMGGEYGTIDEEIIQAFFTEGTMIPFRMRIGNIGMDPNNPNQTFEIKLIADIDPYDIGDKPCMITEQDLYAGEGSEILVEDATLSPPTNPALTRRTATSASLSWDVPLQKAPAGTSITYDIYRRSVGAYGYFSFLTVADVDTEPYKVGSTKELKYTDEGLNFDAVYEYFVKASYPTGFSPPSKIVRSDSVDPEGLPSTPKGLKFSLTDQGSTANVKLSWAASNSPAGIKEYIVYRMRTRPPEAYESKQDVDESGAVVIGEAREVIPQEFVRTAETSYLNEGLALDDKCDYYVQAVDNKGARSPISSCLEVSVQQMLPPTIPGELRAGDVLRQGDNVQYAFPDNSDARNVLLGPEREIALRWKPSTDTHGVAGYNIHRVQAASISAADISPFKSQSGKDSLVGNTKDTFFMDKGLEFGETYTYYVEAIDTLGNGSKNSVVVRTNKSPLADLTISNGSKDLITDPAFAYYQTEYTLNVENTVKSIILIIKKADSQAKVMVNGKEAAGNGSTGPLKLEPGKNTVVVEVVPRQGQKGLTQPETTRYTLTVNRAKLDNPPVLTLPESGPLEDGVSTYQATGRLDVKDDRVWTGTVDYGDGSGEEPLQRAADGSFSLEHNYPDHGKFQINVGFKCEGLGLVEGYLEITVQNLAREQAAEAAVVAYETAPITTLDQIKTAEALGTTASDKAAMLVNAIIKQRLQARIKAQTEIVAAAKKALEAGDKPFLSIISVSPIITTTLPGSTAGSSYSASLKTENDTSVIWSIDSGSLPDGLRLDAKTGVISGKPTKPGTYTFTVKATSTSESK